MCCIGKSPPDARLASIKSDLSAAFSSVSFDTLSFRRRMTRTTMMTTIASTTATAEPAMIGIVDVEVDDRESGPPRRGVVIAIVVVSLDEPGWVVACVLVVNGS